MFSRRDGQVRRLCGETAHKSDLLQRKSQAEVFPTSKFFGLIGNASVHGHMLLYFGNSLVYLGERYSL